MKIVIVGAGAMGSLFGGLLANSGNHVSLIDIWKEHIECINKKGLLIKGIDEDKYIRINAFTNVKEIKEKPDLIIVFVKSYHTENAAREVLPLLKKDTSVLTLQNGLGNIDILSKYLGSKGIIAGTTSYGSTILAPGSILLGGSGTTCIGELNGSITKRIKDIAEMFNKAGIITEITQNVLGLIWTKLIINVGINALGVLLRVKNGELIQGEFPQKIQKALVEEAVLLAKKKNIKLIHKDMVKQVAAVCEQTKDNVNSMLQDVLKKRKTEIDFINGAIVNDGKYLNVSTPVNQVITDLIKSIEEKYEKQISF